MAARLSLQRASAQELRRIFNSLYLGPFQSGQLQTVLKKDNHPSPVKSEYPDCTRSQIIVCYDKNGQKIAIVHQYLLPNGTLGGSGLPDPKWVLFKGKIHFI